jgi:hypothetical protein
MTHMKFPCEMETIDSIPVPKAIEPAPVLLERKPRLRQKPLLGLKDVEFQQPYLISTSEIPFSGANLKNTDWSGTCLNAKSKLTGKVESRLRFAGADLSGADFTNTWLLHPVTQKHLGMEAVVEQCIRPSTGLNLMQQKQQNTLIKHVASIFGRSLGECQEPPRFSRDQKTDKEFILELTKNYNS